MIGLCGAQRVGKSTLAKAYSEKTGTPYLETGASATFARLGLSPKADYPFDTRLMIQKEILKDFSLQYAKAGVRWISDRTPIDMLAYTLADVQRQNVSYAEAIELETYIRQCFDLTNRHFTTLVALQPGIPLIEAEGKAPANAAYMEHINTLVIGLLNDERLEVAHYFIERALINHDQRVKALDVAVGRSAAKYRNNIQTLFPSGLVLH